MPTTETEAGRIFEFEGKAPTLGADTYIAPGAYVLGDIILGDQSSIWYQSVLRGDVMPIRVGKRTNIQDLSMVHVSSGTYATHIGDDVTVGHRAIIHGCTIGNGSLIGMGAIIMDGAVIEDHCLIAAGSLISPGTHIPEGSLVMGSPGRVKRKLTTKDIDHIYASAAHYIETAQRHLKSLKAL